MCGNNQATPSQVKIHTKSCLKSFVTQEITEEEVSDSFNKIKIRSAHGIAQIPAKFVKLAKCVLLLILTKLFNNCVNQETFPNEFKTAFVIPISKVPSPHSFGDFQPITLLPIFSKIFEKFYKSE